MRTSYKESDVKLLLKDITGLVEPLPSKEREKLIQSGRHYSEMLPLEYVPTDKYMEIYRSVLESYSYVTAKAVGILSDKIINKKGNSVVLVSIARAGIPIGILIKRYIKMKYEIDVPHYSISIIRGRGIDHNAMKYLLERYKPEQLMLVDGWIGKGAISKEVKKDLEEYEGVYSDLAVVSDAANITEMYGTRDDILIPSSCLNSTVSGLVSRTFLRDDIIGENDFHGAVYYGNLKDFDLSYEFIDEIERHFKKEFEPFDDKSFDDKGIDEVRRISKEFNIEDINLIKPGIGETTRVLLRRVPWKILINESDKDSDRLKHILQLANERNVDIMYYPLKHYKSCGIIKKLTDI